MPTTLRILSALCEEGFLERDNNRMYQVGWKAYQLGTLFKSNDSIKKAALPIMRSLRDQFNETVSLYYKQNIWRICTEQAVSTHDLRRISTPGSCYPLWAGSSAKIFLAYMSPQEIQQVYEEAPETAKAHWKDYMEEVAEAKIKGYATSVAEREPGAASVSCPLIDFSGKLIACLCMSGPSFRFTDEIIAKVIPQMLKESRELSQTFGAQTYSQVPPTKPVA